MTMMLACSAIISWLVCPGVFCAYIADIVNRVPTLGLMALCALRRADGQVVSNYFLCGFDPKTLKWHFSLCCTNWTQEDRAKQRVAFGSSNLIVASQMCLSLKALELGKAWTAIIMDTRNIEDSYPLSYPIKHWSFNWVSDCGVTLLASFYAKFLWQRYSFSWQSLQGFDFEIRFWACNLQWLLCWLLFTL